MKIQFSSFLLYEEMNRKLLGKVDFHPIHPTLYVTIKCAGSLIRLILQSNKALLGKQTRAGIARLTAISSPSIDRGVNHV